MRKLFEIGGLVSAVVLIAFGIATLVIGLDGRDTVASSIKQEQIYGSGDMTPTAIAGEVAAAKTAQTVLFKKLNAAGVTFNGLPPVASPIVTPSCSVAGKYVDGGDRARCFAQYMRIHTFIATSGLTYSQMGRYVAKDGAPIKVTDGLGGTSDPKYALVDAKTKQSVANGRRDLWVTYTALTTALNTSYMAAQISRFGLVVGIALLIAGFGFGILAVGGTLRSPEPAFKLFHRRTPKAEGTTPAAA